MAVIWITKATYQRDYTIALEFNDQKKGLVDLKNHLDMGIFKELKDLNRFRSFSLNQWTIQWPNGADYAPEFLYKLCK